jgi:BirA family biotin operon repressor/biotin-[acetyl-CoA-carboxylase] ligase
MLAGVAAVEAVVTGTGVSCGLKWPNDVMAGDRKLGGILVETVLSGASVAYAITGIGLNGNLSAAALGPLPDTALRPTSLRDEAGAPISREAVIIALLRAFDRQYERLVARDDSAIRRRYVTVLNTIGRRVVALDPSRGNAGNVEGIAEDIAENGALILRLPSGSRRELTYGDVTVRFTP